MIPKYDYEEFITKHKYGNVYKIFYQGKELGVLAVSNNGKEVFLPTASCRN